MRRSLVIGEVVEEIVDAVGVAIGVLAVWEPIPIEVKDLAPRCCWRACVDPDQTDGASGLSVGTP